MNEVIVQNKKPRAVMLGMGAKKEWFNRSECMLHMPLAWVWGNFTEVYIPTYGVMDPSPSC